MLAGLGLVVAGLCADPPRYEEFDPLIHQPCSSTRQEVECGCGEYLDWEVDPSVAWYEVTRVTVSTGARAGPWRAERRWDDEMGWGPVPSRWFVLHDEPIPQEGVLYEYELRACNEVGECGAPALIRYRGAPTACYMNGREEACYVGDEVASR